MSGCLASACHGGSAAELLAGKIDPSSWQASGSCWVAADPHTAAYSLLTDMPQRQVKVTARQIMARYAPDGDGTGATSDPRCVACHTNPALAAAERFNEPHFQSLRNEGASCEACHGSAGGWVVEHTSWKGDRKAAYASTGMVPLYDLGERALACSGCHVGAPADPARGLPLRDMNHDMIAAGHPRLNFDFAEYLCRLPTHWEEKDRSKNPPKPHALNSATTWYVGRVAHAESACRLLADRAERSKSDLRTPWPEFAEFNCASCHHQLRAASDANSEAQWRKTPETLAGRPLGATPWQPIWPMTHAAGVATPTRDAAPLRDVTRAMSVTRPNRESVADSGRRGAEQMASRRMRLASQSGVDCEAEALRLLPPESLRVPEWDSAAQLFFAFAAFERASPRPRVPEFRKMLAALRTEDWPQVNWAEVDKALEAIRRKRQ
jgi:hypothetical protein